MARFQKGQSGNPGGRPRAVAAVRDAARKHTTKAIDTLVACLDAPAHNTRVAAAIALLDRGWGRPSQAVGGDEEMPELIVRIVDPTRAGG